MFCHLNDLEYCLCVCSQSWDNELAKGARDRARHCKTSHHHPGLAHFGHPLFGWMGENIWLGAPFSAFSVENAIHRWSKGGAYSLKNNNCSRSCGHYAQVCSAVNIFQEWKSKFFYQPYVFEHVLYVSVKVVYKLQDGLCCKCVR